MTNNKFDSLYTLIKKISKEKGRALKIVCDWDETIQPLKPMAIWEKIVNPTISFKEFFEDFWDKVSFDPPAPSGGPGDPYEGPGFGQKEGVKSYSDYYKDKKEIQDAIKSFEEEKLAMKNAPNKWEAYANSFYGRLERFFETPFLTISDELILAIKENLISEIIIISSYNTGKPGMIAGIGKQKKQHETFGKLPITKIEYTPMEKKGKVEGRRVSTNLRWDIIKEKYSDFDMFIDDSTKAIKGTKKYFPDRIYVLPAYKTLFSTFEGQTNIFYVKNSVSDLKDEDFEKLAKEMREKKNKDNTQSERERDKSRPIEWLGWELQL